MATVRPIKPSDIIKQRRDDIPDVVIEAFNRLVAEKWSGHSAVVHQKDVVAFLVEAGLDKDEIFKRHWLNVEDVYRSAGWIVKYDAPAYSESYEPYFTFKRKGKP